MSDIAYIIYNRYFPGAKQTKKNEFVTNGFIKIHTFTDNYDFNEEGITSQILDNAIFNTESSGTYLIFSPMGSLYIIENDEILVEYINPITILSGEQFENIWKEVPVDYTKFSKYNSGIVFPQYFASIAGHIGYGGVDSIGSGFLLYRDKKYGETSENANYHLLISSINRVYKKPDGEISLPINSDTPRVQSYCSTIQHQDEVCYCSNTFNRCNYATAGGEGNFNHIINAVDRLDNSSSSSALNAFITQCACNPVCQNWGGYDGLKPKPQCGTNNTNTFCGVNIAAADGGEVKLGDLKIEENCGKTNPLPPIQNTPKSDNTPVYIMLGIALVVIIVSITFLVKK